jgi:Tfp pilus assembly protein PilF
MSDARAKPRDDDFDPKNLDEVPDDDLMEIWQAIKDGANTPAEALDFDPAAMNATEALALGYFENDQFDIAARIYGFMVRMDPAHGGAWRGLGACLQARGEVEMAAAAFEVGVHNTKGEDRQISLIYLGECLCRMGERAGGVKVLQAVLANTQETTRTQRFLKRARLIVEANGVLARPRRAEELDAGS